MNEKKRKLDIASKPQFKRRKQKIWHQVPIYEDLKIHQRQTIIIKPQFESLLPSKRVLVLKAIIANEKKGMIFDIHVFEDQKRRQSMKKFQNLDKDEFYIIYGVLVLWHPWLNKKIAHFDQKSGPVNHIKSWQLTTYGQKFSCFQLKWDKNKLDSGEYDLNAITTNYYERDIQRFNVAGFVDSKVTVKKFHEDDSKITQRVYMVFIKNKRNEAILLNYYGEEAPKIEQGKIYIFTSVAANGYEDIKKPQMKQLYINGPWYAVPWKWTFDEIETKICYDNPCRSYDSDIELIPPTTSQNICTTSHDVHTKSSDASTKFYDAIER